MRGADEDVGLALEFRYQLNVEDAYAIRDYDLVVFADAAAPDAPEDVALTEIGPSATIAFTTHEMSPASVLALCHELYGRAPRAFTLAIRGCEWDLVEGLSEGGRTNLARALEILRRFLAEQSHV
jgi:Ni,Fe-hydrogenase maturation factor